MNFIKHLEEKNIITREESGLWTPLIFAYVFSLLCIYIFKFSSLGLSVLITVIGGLCNLYVIDYNNQSMPVRAQDDGEFKIMKQKNQNRNFCRLNSKTRLRWLADTIHFRHKYYSLGDILVYVGAISIAVSVFIVVVNKIKL